MVAAVSLGLVGCSDRLPSSYYRVTAHLMHGDEPVTIDWVVECRYFARSGEMRGYVRGTVVPYVFGVATRDGGMALMVAPAYCGQTGTRTDYMPFLMWGDKAGDFSFFNAYVSRRAFDNPASKLKVVSVELRPSDKAERDSWKKTAPKNVVPAKPNPFLEDSRGLEVGCIGVALVRVPEELQKNLLTQWSRASRRYWIPSGDVRTNIENAAHFEDPDPSHNRFVEGRGLPSGDASFEVIAEGDRDHFHQLQISNPMSRFMEFSIRLNPNNIGLLNCSASRFITYQLIYTYNFPDGRTPPITLHSRDAFMRDVNTLFVRYGFGFDVERGDKDDE